MRKLITTVFISVLFFAQTAFAQQGKDEPEVNATVDKAFKKDFSNVENVTWRRVKEVYIATFSEDNAEKVAYYTLDGKLAATGTTIPKEDLPLSTAIAFHDEYKDADIKQVLEYKKEGSDPIYYMFIEDENNASIIKIDSEGMTEVLRKKKIH